MTERTIRSVAKEFAGAFYERNRSPAFRIAFPTARDYIRGHMHLTNGAIKQYTPGWFYFIEVAKKALIEMLKRKDVHDNIKEGIHAALVEDYVNGTSAQAKPVFQVTNDGKK